MKHAPADLKQMQSLPLEAKIAMTERRIQEWYERYNGEVYVSFSGGKDSTVLLHLARGLYPDIPAVFVDTGLEYPEVRAAVKKHPSVTYLRPEMRFDEVLDRYGFVYPSKDVALYLYYARKEGPNQQHYVNRFLGLNDAGEPSAFRARYKKFAGLLGVPFSISHMCCVVMKERPLRKYEQQTKRKPISALLAAESQRRKQAWLKTGCNDFKNGVSTPMSFWTEQDVLQYLVDHRAPIPSVYGEIVKNKAGKWETTGEKRTGCMFCLVGCQLDSPNKFQRMRLTHPRQYDYCMRPREQKGLGIAAALDYLGIPKE